MDCKQHHEHHEEEDDNGANVGGAGQVTDLVGGVHRGHMGGSCLRLLLLSVCVCVCVLGEGEGALASHGVEKVCFNVPESMKNMPHII